MAAPTPISRRALAANPSAVWNAFVDLAHRPARDLDTVQRIAHYAFRYESEVQNGGHLQFFENAGVDAVPLVRAALEALGAHAQVRILDDALGIRAARETPAIETAQALVDEALRGDYDACDAAYHARDPELTTILEDFLARNQDAFVRLVD